MENRTFAPQEQMFHFSYFKNFTLQRRPKTPVWSKGLLIFAVYIILSEHMYAVELISFRAQAKPSGVQHFFNMK